MRPGIGKASVCAVLAAGVGLVGAPQNARACGGLVQPETGSVGQDAQRAFFSVRQNTTEVVLQVVVPQTSSDFGVVVPMPVQPTVASEPVDADELDDLDEETQPEIDRGEETGDMGCGCGAGAIDDRSLAVGQQLVVGPVEVTTLTADDASAINTWLSQNGYTLPAGTLSTLESYAGPGKWFVAFKRAQTESSVSAVGIQLTLPGDHRDFALRLARVNANDELRFTVFISHTVGVAPSFPYAALTLNDLNKTTIRNSTYRAAVKEAVAAHDGRAFIIEGIRDRNALGLGTKLLSLTDPNHKITRISSIMLPNDLNADVSFNAPAPTDDPNSLDASGGTVSSGEGNGGGGAPGSFLLAVAGLLLWWMTRKRWQLEPKVA